MSCLALQSGYWQKCSDFLYSRGKWVCSLCIRKPIPFFQCNNRFLCTGSLHATCVVFEVITPKWGKSTTPPHLWDANPKTWIYAGIKDLWHCAVGKLTVNVEQTHWAYLNGACSSNPTFISHHKLLWLRSYSLSSWWNTFGEEKDAAH